jgi:nucleotide-binding universal stress UspA family protein
MYKNIVVGFDDSATSLNALSEVSSRVRNNGSHITLVHAVYHDSAEFDITQGQLDKRLTIGKELCVKTADVYSSEFGVEIGNVVCQGEPDEVLADYARSTGADIIALGTHGRKGLKRLLMGSVTSGVIEKAPCDVLVVSSACPHGCTGGYGSVLVAYDGSEHSKKALEKAAALAETDKHEVTVLYVIPGYQEMVGFFKTESIKNAIYDEAEKILETARAYIDWNGHMLGTIVQEGHAAEKITEMAAKLGSELIIMGSHGWTGVDKAIMGSTTERVITNAPCPVLVVR